MKTLSAVFNRMGKAYLPFWVEVKGWLKPEGLLGLGYSQIPADLES
jgi:hypothetical protein